MLFGSGNHIEQPAVTLSIAKRPGANAIAVADEVLRKVGLLKGTLIPADVTVDVTRNYGETAAEKSNELLFHMGIAIFSVTLLIWLTLGWRESGIVAVAIPATLALTLLVFYLYGFTLNRITLFALIFSIGILVDDAIVVVENIVRHFHLPGNQGRNWSAIVVEAVNEVGNPTILATFAVIAAVLPMAFVGGLMGPYMLPIPIGASAAMFWSLLIAFIVTPWASIRILRWGRKSGERQPFDGERQPFEGERRRPAGSVRHPAEHSSAPTEPNSALTDPSSSPAAPSSARPEDFFTKLYRRMMGPLINHAGWRWSFLTGITLLLLGSFATVGLGWHITIEVFRDLGSAFAACLVLIYVLMVGWFRSFITPAIVMIAIPFSLIGILPAHGLMGAFFSATSMIGFMAGGGIVVRNPIILVDFIELRLREGMALSEAVIDAGAVRFRPMLLTAMAVIVGAAVILADPIFQGLAIALMAGEVASLLISRMAVPVLYHAFNRR